MGAPSHTAFSPPASGGGLPTIHTGPATERGPAMKFSATKLSADRIKIAQQFGRNLDEVAAYEDSKRGQ